MGAEHGARHLVDDGAELFLAARDVDEQRADGGAHALHLPSQARQLAFRFQRQGRVEIAAREAVGEGGQGAQRAVQAAAQEGQDQRQRDHHLHRQHQRVVELLAVQGFLALQVVHLDGHLPDRLAAHHDLALGAQHPAQRTRRRMGVDQAGVGRAAGHAAHLDPHHRGVAHHRVDQRARGVGVHVPERFLDAEGEDLGVALQGGVEFGDGGAAFLHRQQQVAGGQGRDHQAAHHHDDERAVDRAAV